MTYTRQQVADAALALRGCRFRHQGRSAVTGIDCCGLLYVMLESLDYPGIVDVVGYRTSPPASVIYETLKANFDEIDVESAGLGDIFLMRIGGRKAKHASVLVQDELDLPRGIEPQIIHAYAIGNLGRVVVEPLEYWKTQVVTAFRLRGLEV